MSGRDGEAESVLIAHDLYDECAREAREVVGEDIDEMVDIDIDRRAVRKASTW